MTPGARVAAAIEILDIIGAGTPAEPALTRWARGHRFAGSGDRAAIRDHVFDVLRCKRSFEWLGGGTSGRQLMIGWAIASNAALEDLFSGVGHAPAPVEAGELVDAKLEDADEAVQLDCPDWLLDVFKADLGKDAGAVLHALQNRAPVFLRVNLGKSTLEDAQAALALDGIETRPHKLSPTALEVIANPRKIRNSLPYNDGWVELQDAASQAVVDQLLLSSGDRVLDYCAGGGGKSLAMAGRGVKTIFAYDTDTPRMVDLPERALRADADIRLLDDDELSEKPYDLVLCDAPCSGSGSWRRSPGAKWDLTLDRLNEYTEIQMNILLQVSDMVAPNGHVAYVTCSLFDQENHAQVEQFLRAKPEYSLVSEKQFTPLNGGDGFYVALLCRVSKT